MLTIIDEALEELLQSQPVHLTAEKRIEAFKAIIKQATFSRKDYMRYFKDISTATASRDLKSAVDDGLLSKSGDGRLTLYTYLDEYNSIKETE